MRVGGDVAGELGGDVGRSVSPETVNGLFKTEVIRRCGVGSSSAACTGCTKPPECP